ncbi:MAG: efflux RND transporter periplasmic adaptor subunit [Janthinobacterium lividum]
MNRIVYQALPLALVVGAAGCQSKAQVQEAAVPPLQVEIQSVAAGSGQQNFTYSGTLEPEKSVQLGFAVAGIVNNVAVQEGQRVRQGQLLARIDDAEYRNALAITQAGLAQSQDLYQRLSELYQQGSLPAKDYVDIKTRVAQAQAQQNITAKHIADSRLCAPMAGVVSARLVEPGSAVSPGTPAFALVKTDVLYAKITVPESEVGALRRGQAVRVAVPTVSGILAIINPQADPMTRTYSVKVKLGNADGQLLPGMLTTVTIPTQRRAEALSVPAGSVVRDADDLTYVYVVNDQRQAIRKRIITSNMLGNNILIKSGLQPGERVVVKGQNRVQDGQTVSFL